MLSMRAAAWLPCVLKALTRAARLAARGLLSSSLPFGGDPHSRGLGHKPRWLRGLAWHPEAPGSRACQPTAISSARYALRHWLSISTAAGRGVASEEHGGLLARMATALRLRAEM
jgi:hypothetical protein